MESNKKTNKKTFKIFEKKIQPREMKKTKHTQLYIVIYKHVLSIAVRIRNVIETISVT